MVMTFKEFKEKAELEKFPVSVTLDVVFNNGTVYGYIVDDFKYTEKYRRQHPDIHVYTLIEKKDGKRCIVSGYRKCPNTIGYLFGKNTFAGVEVEVVL